MATPDIDPENNMIASYAFKNIFIVGIYAFFQARLKVLNDTELSERTAKFVLKFSVLAWALIKGLRGLLRVPHGVRGRGVVSQAGSHPQDMRDPSCLSVPSQVSLWTSAVPALHSERQLEEMCNRAVLKTDSTKVNTKPSCSPIYHIQSHT